MNTNELRDKAESHYKSGRLPEALNAYAMLCDQAPADAQAWHMQAAISGMLGQFQKTADCCEKAIELAPGAAAIYTNYANALIELARYDDAQCALENATRLTPGDTNTLTMLGNLHLLMENYGKAAMVFQQVFRSAPDNAEAASCLARLLLDSGKIDESVSVCEQALSCNPDHNYLLLIQIECHLASGATDKCRMAVKKAMAHNDNLAGDLYAIIRKVHADKKYAHVIPAVQMLMEIFPKDYRFCLILADSQIKTGSSTAAIATIGHCKQDAPVYDAQILLAEAYKNSHDEEKAKSCLLNASRAASDEVAPVVLLSRIHQDKGETEEALQQLESFIEKHPDAHQALVEAGNIHNRTGNYPQAEQHYNQAINSQPDYAIAHNCLGMLYLDNKMEEKASHCFETAIRHDKQLLPAHCNLAYIHCSRGDYQQADACYDRALGLDPEHEDAIAGKAIICERKGNANKALELVSPLIHAQTVNINTLLIYARTCHHIGREREAIDLLEQALKKPLIKESDRMQIYFSIGKLLDTLKEYDRAFLNYERGNKMNRFPFDRDAQVRFIDTTISSFSAGNMGKIRRSTNRGHGLVFIVGMPRSGTTLTEQILSSHPDVYGAGELSHIRDIAAEIPAVLDSTQPFPLGITDISPEILDRFSSSHLQAMQSLANGSKVIIDKMPSNFMFLGLIELLFPNARILHCVRDPMDTCLSCYFQQFSSGQRFSYDQSDLALFYQQYRRLMQHWKATLSTPIMDIRYEMLVQDTEGLSRKMLEFTGLDWDPACVEFHRSKRKILTASYDQVRRPVYKSSIGRWKHYKRHLSRLHEELAEFYEPVD